MCKANFVKLPIRRPPLIYLRQPSSQFHFVWNHHDFILDLTFNMNILTGYETEKILVYIPTWFSPL